MAQHEAMKTEVVIASLPDRENVVTEIWYGDTHLAEVTNEHGVVEIDRSRR